MLARVYKLVAIATACLILTVSCAVLPDTDALIDEHAGQAARFENAGGPLSAQKNAAVVADLKRKSGDIDILDKQIALEQAIVGSPLIMGNKVILLQDGAATYAAMFAAIRPPVTISTWSPTSSRTMKSGTSLRICCWSSSGGAFRST